LTILKQTLAILVMILAVVGALVCLALLIGSWSANTPLTNAATGSLLLVENYVGMTEQVTGRVVDNLESMLGEVTEIETTLTGMDEDQEAQLSENIKGKLNDRFGPLLTNSKNSIVTLSNGAEALNRTLTMANRLPGVALPPIVEELEPISQKLEEVSGQVEELQGAIAGANFDGSKVLVTVSNTGDRIEALEQELTRYEAGMERTLRASAEVRSRLPGWIDLMSVLISILAILFGAGQVSLFIHAWGWFKEA